MHESCNRSASMHSALCADTKQNVRYNGATTYRQAERTDCRGDYVTAARHGIQCDINTSGSPNAIDLCCTKLNIYSISATVCYVTIDFRQCIGWIVQRTDAVADVRLRWYFGTRTIIHYMISHCTPAWRVSTLGDNNYNRPWYTRTSRRVFCVRRTTAIAAALATPWIMETKKSEKN